MKKIILACTAFMLLFSTADAKKKVAHKKKPKAKTTYYVNGDGTYSTTGHTDATRPSAYKGDRVPENDGQKKNKERNLNYNSGQPLPSNAGGGVTK